MGIMTANGVIGRAALIRKQRSDADTLLRALLAATPAPCLDNPQLTED